TFGNGSARRPGKRSEPSDSELAQLLLARGLQRDEPERKWREELARPLVGDDENLPGTRDARRREGGEPACGRADARVPGRADGGERPPERPLEPAVQTLDPGSLEIDTPRLRGLDRESRVLEPAQDLLPGLLGARRILLDKGERGARRQRLPHAHPRPDAGRLSRGRDRPDQRLGPFDGRERSGPKRERGPSLERRPKRKSGDEDTRDHRRTHVLSRTHVRRQVEAAEGEHD